MNKLIYAIGIVVATTFSTYPKTEKVKVDTEDSIKIENNEKLSQITKTDTIVNATL